MTVPTPLPAAHDSRAHATAGGAGRHGRRRVRAPLRAPSREGALGTIASIDLRHHHADLLARCRAHPDRATLEAANLEALAREVRLAKTYSEGRGMIAVNVMKAVSAHADYVRVACDAGADAIVMGAGLPLDLPDLTQGHDIALIPILSDSRGIALVLKKWMKKGRLPDAIVIEHPAMRAATSASQIDDMHDARFDARVLDETAQVMATLGLERDTIPLIVAGGIGSHDAVRAALAAGANGVQIGTPFAVTEEGRCASELQARAGRCGARRHRRIRQRDGAAARGGPNSWLDRYLRNEARIRSKLGAFKQRCPTALECLSVCGLRDGIEKFGHFCIDTRLAAAPRRRRERAVLPRARSAAVRHGDPQRARSARAVADGPCRRACGKPPHVLRSLDRYQDEKRPYWENGIHSLGVRTMHKAIQTFVTTTAVAASHRDAFAVPRGFRATVSIRVTSWCGCARSAFSRTSAAATRWARSTPA
jgi:nitronate monooxygenase